MAFTDHCDVFGAVHEDGLNLIIGHVMRQRPSLFNYGTDAFIARPEMLCEPIDAHPEVRRRGNPLLTREALIPVPGTNGIFGFDWCLQITKLAIDFHKGNAIALPPQLGVLQPQRLALAGRACFGLICPGERVDALGDALADIPPPRKDDKTGRDDQPRPPPRPLPPGKPICFCLELFAVLHIERLLRPEGTFLVPRLDGLEIVDIQPQGMEDAIECAVATTLRLGVLPRLRFALDTFAFDLGGFLSISVSATPISAAVPFNPSIEDDQMKVFVEVGP
ncbi:MAG: hypothetical protein K2X74_10355 [Acetobacteraceae bacterium]|nr:hypothetical protein [Acetobacteraceae bacterium]